MSTVSVYQGGLSMALNRRGGNPSPVKRGKITGWTQPQVKRMERFLWSVPRDERLTGYGYAVTLTLRDCPASAAEFHRLRKVWIVRAQRSGMVRLHWVIEWTARKIPHLHLAAYWPEKLSAREQHALKLWWSEISGQYGAQVGGQHVADVTGVGGWFEYLTKHSGRGVAHYQRSGIPEGWESSGRLWGRVGDWPIEPPIEVELTVTQHVHLRRLFRSWRVARARALLVRAQRFGDTPQNLRSRRQALVYARRSNRVREDVWRLPGASAPIPESEALRLVTHVLTSALAGCQVALDR